MTQDYELFMAALKEDSSYLATLSSQIVLNLSDFYSQLKFMPISAKTGEGVDLALQQVLKWCHVLSILTLHKNNKRRNVALDRKYSSSWIRTNIVAIDKRNSSSQSDPSTSDLPEFVNQWKPSKKTEVYVWPMDTIRKSYLLALELEVHEKAIGKIEGEVSQSSQTWVFVWICRKIHEN